MDLLKRNFEIDSGERSLIIEAERLNSQLACSRKLHRVALICQFMKMKLKWNEPCGMLSQQLASPQSSITSLAINVVDQSMFTVSSSEKDKHSDGLQV